MRSWVWRKRILQRQLFRDFLQDNETPSRTNCEPQSVRRPTTLRFGRMRAASTSTILIAMCANVRGGRNWALQAIVLLALLARVLVPPGYMVASVGDKWVKVVLCSAHGAIDVFVNPATYEITDKPALPAKLSDDKEPPCAFSALAQFTPPDTTFTPPVRVAAAAGAHAPRRLEPRHALDALPPPATGPPIRT